MVQSSNYELCSYRQRQIKNLIRNTQYHYQLKDKTFTFDSKVDFRFSAFFDALTVIVICKIQDWKILNRRHQNFKSIGIGNSIVKNNYITTVIDKFLYHFSLTYFMPII